MNGKLIIIEGVDGSGKSTLIEGLRRIGIFDYMFNYSYPTEVSLLQNASFVKGEHIASIRIFKELIARGKTIVCDRFHLSEYAYGPVKRNYPYWLAKCALDIEDILIKELSSKKVKLIMLGFMDHNNVKGRISNKDYLKNLEEVKKVNQNYIEAFHMSKLERIFIYTDTASKEEVFKQAMNFLC